jgi:hypothetical protein
LSGKLQITKYKLQTSGVLRMYLNAFGEEYETGFLSPIGLFVISDIVIWNLFVFCNLYFVIFKNLAIFWQNFTTR